MRQPVQATSVVMRSNNCAVTFTVGDAQSNKGRFELLSLLASPVSDPLRLSIRGSYESKIVGEIVLLGFTGVPGPGNQETDHGVVERPMGWQVISGCYTPHIIAPRPRRA